MGNKPIRIALRHAHDAQTEEPVHSLEDARSKLHELMSNWQRRAIEGATGTGKSTLACKQAVDIAIQAKPCDNALLIVVHDKERVNATVARLRGMLRDRECPEAWVQPLLGRQSPKAALFACGLAETASRYGQRGRSVANEVCKECDEYRTCDYWTDTDSAWRARIVVTTAAKMSCFTQAQWERDLESDKKGVDRVICDEDVLPALMKELWIMPGDLKRALRWIRNEAHRRCDRRIKCLLRVVPYVESILLALQGPRQNAAPLTAELPAELDIFATDDGVEALRRALPLRDGKLLDPSAPAEWEKRRMGRVPRQVWGRFLDALMADLSIEGHTARASLIHIVPRRSGSSRLHVVRVDPTALRNLRQRDLLVLDATLHPAACALLNLEHCVLESKKQIKVVQALSRLLTPADLMDSDQGALTEMGRRTLRQAAAWINGNVGYILCRKNVEPLLRAEAEKIPELGRTKFVTPKRERGWNADPRARAFVVLGRYAKNGYACVREAHALRAAMLAGSGSTALLDALERQPQPEVFRGRDKPLRYRGEIVERIGKGPADLLAKAIQDADRVATVKQFVGRCRAGDASVLLLRGDPTVPADALVEVQDLAIVESEDERAP